MADKRTPRETETREAGSRKKGWAPPSVLPEPNQEAAEGEACGGPRIVMLGSAWYQLPERPILVIGA
jgi:hypothetical protein